MADKQDNNDQTRQGDMGSRGVTRPVMNRDMTSKNDDTEKDDLSRAVL